MKTYKQRRHEAELRFYANTDRFATDDEFRAAEAKFIGRWDAKQQEEEWEADQ